MTVVDRPGPPPVRVNRMSMDCSEKMIEVTPTMSSVGRSAGSVMMRNSSQRPAPSIRAARYSESGMVLRAPSSSRAMRGTIRHVVATTATAIALVDDPSQSTGPCARPIPLTNAVARPYCELKMNFQ
jgi:hypothetical protein